MELVDALSVGFERSRDVLDYLRARTVMQCERAPPDTVSETFSSLDTAGASDRCTGSPNVRRSSGSVSTAARSRP